MTIHIHFRYVYKYIFMRLERKLNVKKAELQNKFRQKERQSGGKVSANGQASDREMTQLDFWELAYDL